jgi:hypothetical protein
LRSIGSETWWCWCGMCINVVNLLWLQPSLHKPKSMFWTASKTSKIQMPCTEKNQRRSLAGTCVTYHMELNLRHRKRSSTNLLESTYHSKICSPTLTWWLCDVWYISPVTNDTSNFVSFAIHFKVCSKLCWRSNRFSQQKFSEQLYILGTGTCLINNDAEIQSYNYMYVKTGNISPPYYNNTCIISHCVSNKGHQNSVHELHRVVPWAAAQMLKMLKMLETNKENCIHKVISILTK